MVVLKSRKKTKYKNNIDRIEAVRESKRTYQAKYRTKLKALKEAEKEKFSNQKYQQNIYEEIKDLDFNYQSTLKFNQFTSIEYAEKAAKYFTKKLNDNKVITNVIYVFEKKFGNIHIHLAINFKYSFTEMYHSEKMVTEYLYKIWNNDKVQNGTVWLRQFADNDHKGNYLKYIFKEVLPLSKYHFRQKQVDLYYIQSFKNIEYERLQPNLNFDSNLERYRTEMDMKCPIANELNTILNKANISPIHNSLNDNKPTYTKLFKTHYRGLKSVVINNKKQILATLATVMLILI